MPVFTSTAAALGALAVGAAGSTAYSIYSGEKGRKAQKDALRRQEQAQKQAEARALSQQRQSEMAQRAASGKKPNTAALLEAAQEASTAGAAGTMLTGSQGIRPEDLQLGRTTLLGQ